MQHSKFQDLKGYMDRSAGRMPIFYINYTIRYTLNDLHTDQPIFSSIQRNYEGNYARDKHFLTNQWKQQVCFRNETMNNQVIKTIQITEKSVKYKQYSNGSHRWKDNWLGRVTGGSEDASTTCLTLKKHQSREKLNKDIEFQHCCLQKVPNKYVKIINAGISGVYLSNLRFAAFLSNDSDKFKKILTQVCTNGEVLFPPHCNNPPMTGESIVKERDLVVQPVVSHHMLLHCKYSHFTTNSLARWFVPAQCILEKKLHQTAVHKSCPAPSQKLKQYWQTMDTTISYVTLGTLWCITAVLSCTNFL